MTEKERTELLYQAAQNIRQKIITTIGLASGSKLHDDIAEIIMATKMPAPDSQTEQEQLW